MMTPNLVVVCIHLDEEYATIRNDEQDEVNLLNWIIRDVADNERQLPDYGLGAGDTVRLYTRTAPDGLADTLSLDWRDNVWNSGGDTAFLIAPNGAEVSRTSEECQDSTPPPAPPTPPPPSPQTETPTAPVDMGDGSDPPPATMETPNLALMCVHLRAGYVVISNLGTMVVNLEDWVLRDEQNNNLPLGDYELGAGSEVRVYTQTAPEGTPNAISYGRRSDIWNNGGDTAFLIDPSGVEQDSTMAGCN
jgi:hypothetical protein